MSYCLVTHRFSKGDGQGRVNLEIAWELLKKGESLFLVSSCIDCDLLEHPQVEWIEIKVDKWPTALIKGLMFSIKASKWLRGNHKSFDLLLTNGAIVDYPSDVNSAHFVHSKWLNSFNHPFRKNKSLYTLYQWLYTKLNSKWEKRAFSRAKYVVAVSDKVKRDLQDIGVPSERIKVILNGVDIDEFQPSNIDRLSLGLPRDVVIAIFVGDIRTSRKNLDTVLKALTKVPDLHLVVVGSVDDSPYPGLARELDVEQRVHFLGYRQDISDLMKASDFLIFPSRYETFGLVVLEAMASGIPVITSQATPASQLLTFDSGIVVSNPEDVVMLSKEIAYLTKDAEKRREMGIRARAIAENHSWTKMARRYVNLFNQLTELC